MTEDEQEKTVWWVIRRHFNNLPEHHDDLYQEGRYWLIRLFKQKAFEANTAYSKRNICLYLIRMLWAYMYQKVWHSQKTGKHRHERFETIEVEDIYAVESSCVTECYAEELLGALTEINQKIVKDYYYRDSDVNDLVERYGLSKASIIDRLAKGRRAMRRYAEKGVKQPDHKRRVQDKTTGVKFKTVASAAKFYGLRPSTLSRYLSGVIPNKTTLAYV